MLGLVGHVRSKNLPYVYLFLPWSFFYDNDTHNAAAPPSPGFNYLLKKHSPKWSKSFHQQLKKDSKAFPGELGCFMRVEHKRKLYMTRT